MDVRKDVQEVEEETAVVAETPEQALFGGLNVTVAEPEPEPVQLPEPR